MNRVRCFVAYTLQLHFPYLAQELYQSGEDQGNWCHLYRMVVPPEYPTLFFIGLVQPL